MPQTQRDLHSSVQAAAKVQQRLAEARQSYGPSLTMQQFASLEGITDASQLQYLLTNADNWRHQVKESQRKLARMIAQRVQPEASPVSVQVRRGL